MSWPRTIDRERVVALKAAGHTNIEVERAVGCSTHGLRYVLSDPDVVAAIAAARAEHVATVASRSLPARCRGCGERVVLVPSEGWVDPATLTRHACRDAA